MNPIKYAITRNELWEKLQRQNLVEGELPPIDATSAPWYVRVMLGIAGWIGALFLLGFVGAAFAFVVKSAAASLLVGALCCGAAYAIFQSAQSKDFTTQFGLAVSLAGQGLFIAGIFNAFHHETAATYFLIAVFEVILAMLLPNAIHRAFCSAGTMLALAFAVERLGLHGLMPGIAAAAFALVWLHQRRWALKGSLWRPIGYGLALALIGIEAAHLVDMHIHRLVATEHGWLHAHQAAIGTLLSAVVLLWTVARLLQHEALALSSKTGLTCMLAAIFLGLLSVPAPGVTAALLILLLGFSCGNRILMGLGLIGLLGFISHYYYELQSTLLFKSAVLAVSGLVLLAARMALHKYFPLESEKENAHA